MASEAGGGWRRQPVPGYFVPTGGLVQMSGERKLFIHCGLHKTGSTALQRQLSDMATALEEAGFYLPAGKSGSRGSHHAEAHLFRGPRIFRLNADSFDDLAKDLADHPATLAGLSSEDFGVLLSNPGALARIRDWAGKTGRQPILIICLRDQVAVAESLYLQLLRIGCDTTAPEMLAEVVETGQIAWRKWVFHFDYAAMMDVIIENGLEFRLRDYHHQVEGDVFHDFLDAVGMRGALGAAQEAVTANPARLDENIRIFCDIRLGVDPAIRSAAEVLDGLLNGDRPRLGAAWVERISARFAEGNARLAKEHAVDPGAARRSADGGWPRLERVFSQVTLDLVQALAAGKEELGEDRAKAVRNYWCG